MLKGQVIGHAQASVSPDGRILTMVSKIKVGAHGERSQRSVFVRQ